MGRDFQSYSRRPQVPGGSFLLPIVSLSRLTALIAALLVSSQFAYSQEAPTADVTVNVPASPEAAPAPAKNAAPVPEIASEAAPGTTGAGTAEPGSAEPSRLVAESVSYSGGLIIAQGTMEKPVVFETGAGKITAQRVQIDTVNQLVEATGTVRLERQTQTERRELRPRGLKPRSESETTTETLIGQSLKYNFKTQSGELDNANLQLASLFISAASLTINGQNYTARDVLVRPGSMSPEDVEIYGTPPLNIRAKSLTATLGSGNVGASDARSAVEAKGGALYFRNTKILPLPSYIFRAGLGGGSGNESTFQLTPSLSLNSADRVLVTTRVSFPLSKVPGQLTSFADIGLSQRIGVRGGVGVESNTKLGSLTLRARRSDVVETQLTNRIELDRNPELIYNSPSFLNFDLPGGRRAGFSLGSSYGSYGERRIGDDQSTLEASRFTTRVLFTTRLREVDGPFLRLFATNSRYGGIESRYKSRGFEIGYDGQLIPRVRGQIALRSTSLSGQTPFRFDEVEIARELRSTFDIELTPRYLLPIDLRYDLNRRTFRDKSFGILRSYKVFAYGVVYQSARQDLRLEVRQGF